MEIKKLSNLLKSVTILERKPKLKICSNHIKDQKSKYGRYWNSKFLGTATRNGNGWYK